MDETKSFSELLDETSLQTRRFQTGEKLEATIVKITSDWVFLDLGAKSEGYLDKKELLDEKGNVTVKEGDTITAYFVSSRQGEKLFTTKLLTGRSIDDFLYSAYKNRIPVEGMVEKEVKGGFSVRMNQNVSGFCPYSQMDLRKIDDPASYIGRKFNFLISEYSEKGRNVILSRRSLLEEEEKRKIEKLRQSLQVGMTVSGTITNVQSFGAFVDLGGIQALLPVSEMAWGKVEDPRTLYASGDKIEAVIIGLDWENNKLTLSFKAALPDPWDEVVRKNPEGTILKGRVANLTHFGAFVTIENSVEGLLHIARLARGKRIKHAGDVLKTGQEIEVKIEKIDRENRKISLDMINNDQGITPADEEDFRNYLGKSKKPMGTLGDLIKKKKNKPI
jgi:small subunit ribosomal protein S1